ncbi:MAG: glutamate 5-kinase, partial [Dehalococcoidia bacterium]|nr:glutamate 5-kinase [Dehalococcoidia bacterium]
YLNARTTLIALLDQRVVPIINENDVVAVDELQDLSFGDNDALSAQVANLIEADVLLILTDTGGLYTADPATNPMAQLVSFVPVIDEHVEAMAGDSISGRGRGGMATKIKAARLATAAGVSVVIAPGRAPNVVSRALNGDPIGTLFSPVETRLEGRKRWLLSGAATQGSIVVDDGAANALRERGKSLLPAGVVDVNGAFDRGATVDITTTTGTVIAYGMTNYSAADIRVIRGARSSAVADLLGYDYGAEIVHRNNMVLVERAPAISSS